MTAALNGLRASAALDGLARDLYRHHQEYLLAPIQPWDEVPFNVRQVYMELSCRVLRMLCVQPAGATTTDALFHLANALGRAEITSGLRSTRTDNVIGRIQPQGLS